MIVSWAGRQSASRAAAAQGDSGDEESTVGRAGVFPERWLPVFLLVPTLVVLGFFSLYPAIRTLRLSLYRSNLVVGNEQYVGLANFGELLNSAVYRQVIAQTLVFLVLVVGIGLSIALGLAWLASRPIRGAKVYRLLLIYPYALSPAIAGTLWLFLFNPEVGVVNSILGSAFGIRPRWLDNPLLAFTLVVLATVWKGLGFNVVFYLAAIHNLPTEVMEAARIDGANQWQVFRKIVVPLISPMTFFLLFANIMTSLFDSFGLVDILTRGGPVRGQTGVTTFLVYQLYQDGFRNFKTGAAASQAVSMILLVVCIVVLQFRFGHRKVHYAA